ncbi:MAG TPA: hypothetical protein VNX18_00100 [Bryobacteraceae bacterium]|nr:hypothetical protein [Bryobacteraceae bacterium]
MFDFIAWRFLLFAAAFGLLMYLQFYLGHRQWNRLKGEQAGEIDVNYVRTENYMAQSFRMKVKDWLQLPVSQDREFGPVIMKGHERIRTLAGMDLADHATCDDILVLEQNFSCGQGCSLTREVLVHGNSNIGSESRLQSMAADGDLMLGEKVSVARWVDSNGELTLSAGCHVGSRVTSLTRIRLGLGVEIPSASAPQIVTAEWDSKLPGEDPASRDLLEIAFPDGSEAVEESLAAAKLNAKRFVQLGGDTWLYKGEVRPPVPVRLRRKLAVAGDCYFPEGTVLEFDVKAGGSIFLGPSCVIRGNLVADGHIFLGPGCRFSGLVHAEKTLLLSRGTRGFRVDGMVAAYAGEELSLETDVALKGKIASGARAVVIDAAAAQAWRDQRRIQDDGSAVDQVHTS